MRHSRWGVGLASALALVGCSVSMGGSADSDGDSVSMQAGPREETQVEQLDRTVPPETGSPPAVSLPQATEFSLGNGLRVVLVEKHEVPVVAIELQLRGGASAETRGQAGLSALTADLLDEGTASRSAMEIAGEIERLGASFSSFAGRDASRVRMSVVSGRLGPSLAIFGEVVREASFPEREIERVRTEQLTRILQGRDEPRVLADNALAHVLYGDAHPYGQPVIGTEASVASLTRDHVLDFYRGRYHAGNATLVVAGDVSQETLEPLLETVLGSWRSAAAAVADGAAQRGPDATGVYLVDKPGAAQSEIRVGRVATDRRTDDFYRLTVLNTVLGGSFTSRLNMRLREEKGFTYGARSGFALRRMAGPFVAGSAVHTPVTDSAVVEFLGEIRRMADEPVPVEELERARNFVALRLPQSFETVSDLASRVSDLVLHELPLDYYDAYVDAVLAVTSADVQAAAQRYLSGGFAIVVVGDRSVVEAPLRALGAGPVEVLEPEDGASAEDPTAS